VSQRYGDKKYKYEGNQVDFFINILLGIPNRKRIWEKMQNCFSYQPTYKTLSLFIDKK
jgi:hypothetical protein